MTEAESGKVIVDLSGDTKRFVLLKGGHGGNGNQHYATSTMQAPKYAQPGQPARELNLLLELKLIADVGLVGFPNVGKSTLLSESTNARPKVADYHFTTLAPMLGVVDLDDERSFVMADIPGLIEGAAEGAGLGHDFLQHIERTRVLIHVIDAAGLEGRDPLNDIDAINAELAKYNADLTKKKQILAANKTDLLLPEEEEEILQRLHEKLDPLHVPVFSISAATGKGVRDLLSKAHEIVSTQEEDSIVYAQEYDPEEALTREELPFTVTRDKKTKDFLVEGPRVERMLGYTNLETEKGFMFFQKFIEENGIADELKALGIREGDTVRIYGHAFEYYDS